MMLALLFMTGCLGFARKLFGRKWLTNMQVWFLFLFFLMDFIGIHSMWLTDGEQVQPTLIWVLYLLPTFLLAANVLIPHRRSGLQPLPGGPSMNMECGTGFVIWVISILGVIFLGIYIREVPHVPLLVALVGSDDVSESRADSTLWQAGTVFKYVWLLVVRYSLPLVTLAAFVRSRITNLRWHRLAAWFLIPITYFSLMIDAQKAQVVFFSVQLLIAAMLLRRWRGAAAPPRLRSAGRFVFKVGVVALAFECIILMYFSFMKNSHIPGLTFWEAHQSVAEAIFRRVVITQARPVQVIFDAFPDQHPYLMGRTFPFADVLGFGSRFDLSEFAFQKIYGVKFGGASTLFVSEFYADFGPLGCLFSILAFSFAFVWIERRMRARVMTPEGIVAYSFVTGYVMRLAITQVIMGLALPLLAYFIYVQAKHLASKLTIPSPPGHDGP